MEKHNDYYDLEGNIFLGKEYDNNNCFKRSPTPKQAKKENKKFPYKKLNKREVKKWEK